MNHNKYKYVKNTEPPPAKASLNSNVASAVRPSSSFKVANPVNQSASKLDDLLERCRQIGPAVTPKPAAVSTPSLPPLPPSSVNGNPYKLVKNPAPPSSHPDSKRLTANINKLNLTSQTNPPASGPFKLTNKVAAKTAHSFVRSSFKIDKTKPSFRNVGSASTKLVNSAFSSRSGPQRLNINVILGRQLDDLSKNKYKFIRRRSSSESSSAFYSSRPMNPFSLNRFRSSHKPSVYATLFSKPGRFASSRKQSILAAKRSRHVPTRRFLSDTKLLNFPVAAAANRSDQIVSLSGVKYQVSGKGNKLKRLNSKELKTTKPGEKQTVVKNKYKLVNLSRPTTSSSSSTNPISNQMNVAIANNLVYRSIMLVNRNKLVRKSAPNPAKTSSRASEKAYCMFFNRFGRCSRGNDCPLIHDPKRVVLCPRFLRGTCKVKDCPFSHDAGPEKTPLCSFFAAGHCNRENCPYSHIYLGKDAEFCLDFAKGFCPLGTLCNKAHVYECPDFNKDQKCPRGNLCPLIHRNASLKKTNKRKRTKSLTGSSGGKEKSSKLSSTCNVDKRVDPPETARVNMDFEASFIAFKRADSATTTTTAAAAVGALPPVVQQQSRPAAPPESPQEPLKLRPSFKKS